MYKILFSTLLVIFFYSSQAQTPNVQLILDVSGSMWINLDSGETKIDAAKTVLTDFVGGLPDTGLNMGLRFYGATVSGIDAGACTDSQLAVPMNGMQKREILNAIESTDPKGGTPIVYAINEAIKDFASISNEEEKLIILVTDGAESCGEDLEPIVRKVKNSNIDLQVIGFGLPRDVAETFASVGAFENAMDALELATVLEETTQEIFVVPPTPTPLVTQSTVQTSSNREDEIRLTNGDKLSGQVVTEAIMVKAAFGTIGLTPNDISEINVDSEGVADITMVAGDELVAQIVSPSLDFKLASINSVIPIESIQIKSMKFDLANSASEIAKIQGEILDINSRHIIEATSYSSNAGARGSDTYKDHTGSQLTDGVIGTNEWEVKKFNALAYDWVGWGKGQAQTVFEFGEPVEVKRIFIGFHRATSNGIRIPLTVSINDREYNLDPNSVANNSRKFIEFETDIESETIQILMSSSGFLFIDEIIFANE